MSMKLFRRFTAIALSMVLVMSMCVVTSFGASSAPKVEKVRYEGKGKVDVDFYGEVRYKSPKVTVKDSSGKKYTATIIERDDDDLDFKIKNYKTGKKYSFSISGIKRAGAGSYTTVKGTFKISSSTSLKIKEIDYDAEDGELSIEFDKKVKWNKPAVKVYDSNGKTYATRILEKDNDEIEVRVSGLKSGSRYAAAATKYTTVKKAFRAIDD